VQTPGTDTTAPLRRAVEEAGVAFVPGCAFRARGGERGGDALRLNVPRTTTDEIHDGIARLGRRLRPRGPAIALPDAAAECAASRANIETHEPRS
jgi:DNA-binding transcriptional MocR family regulator